MITNQPVLTIGAVLLALVVAIVGGVAVITNDLAFNDYIQAVGVVAAGLGLGSGYARGQQARAGATPPSRELPTDYQ